MARLEEVRRWKPVCMASFLLGVLHLARMVEQIRPVLHFAVESRIMNALYGFGFTRAFIFPYDELYFCRSGACASAHLSDFDRAQMLYFFENFSRPGAPRALPREDRAAMSLARLWRDQGKLRQARGRNALLTNKNRSLSALPFDRVRCPLKSYGEAMTRRTKAGGKGTKLPDRKSGQQKPRGRPQKEPRLASPRGRKTLDIEQLVRERDEALEQQEASSQVLHFQ